MEEDKKEESIERIIKILEQHLENSETMFEDFGTLAIEYADIKRISNVLSRLKQLEEENKQLESIKDEAIRRYNFESIPKSKVKELLSEIKTEYSKIDKESDEYFKQEDKTMQDYYSECTRIATLQTLAYVIDSLEEILKEE